MRGSPVGSPAPSGPSGTEIRIATMHCTSCGHELEEGSAYCPKCGTPASGPPSVVNRCPRCGYRGDGIAYFRRPAHVGLLLLTGLVSYGVGAFFYWIFRRNDSVCPSCGLRWTSSELDVGGDGGKAPSGGGSIPASLPSNGSFRRYGGIALLLMALLLTVIGITEAELTAAGIGGVMALAGGGSFWWGHRALEARRRAVLTAFQRKALRLARKTGGILTATEVAAGLDVNMAAAERILISMDDGFRVRSEITEEGVLLYEFPEIRHRARLSSGDEDDVEGEAEPREGRGYG